MSRRWRCCMCGTSMEAACSRAIILVVVLPKSDCDRNCDCWPPVYIRNMLSIHSLSLFLLARQSTSIPRFVSDHEYKAEACMHALADVSKAQPRMHADSQHRLQVQLSALPSNQLPSPPLDLLFCFAFVFAFTSALSKNHLQNGMPGGLPKRQWGNIPPCTLRESRRQHPPAQALAASLSDRQIAVRHLERNYRKHVYLSILCLGLGRRPARDCVEWENLLGPEEPLRLSG